MVANARRPVEPGRNPFWLNELKEAHERVLGAIGELAELTRGSVPGKGELASVRWRLSAASLSRRLIWGRIHAFLSRRVSDPAVDRDLRQLQETDMRLMQTSTEHVGRWPLDAILGDWAGYCQASEAMRRKMADAILQEKQLLYPILRETESDG